MNDGQERSLFEALRQWFASEGEQAQPAGKDVADAMNRAMPDAVSARSAIEQDRRRKAEMDRMLRESEQ